jgi:hypothetical protein
MTIFAGFHAAHAPRMGMLGARAATALMALPAGVVLGGQAAASVIQSNQYMTIDLASYAASPVSITSGTTIAPGTGDGIFASAAGVRITNAGDVQAAGGVGIVLGAGGTINNQGNISGLDAIRLDAGGTVNNAAGALISAASYGILANNASATVTNAGSITAANDGVSLNDGGSVVNSAGGVIHGDHMGVYTGTGFGTVANAGLITATNGDGVSLYNGGTLTNAASGRILGGYSGVYAGASGSVVQNAGLISGPHFGVYLTGASSVANSGTITGGIDGVIGAGRGAVVENSGVISGTTAGVKLAAQGNVQNSGEILGGTVGVQLAAAGVLSNAGTIAGATGILVHGSGTTLVDTGLVESTAAGGDAIDIAGGVNALTLGTGAQIVGNIDGGGSASQIALQGSGVLSSDIVGFGAASALEVASGASWVASGSWTIAQVVNAGTLQAGVIGTPLTLTGDYTNDAAATMQVLVTPNASTALHVTGTAALAGRLVYVLAPGSYMPGTVNFLTASGGVSGAFASVTAAQSLRQTLVSSTTLAQTQNAVSVAQATSAAASPASASAIEIASTANATSLVLAKAFRVAPLAARIFGDAGQAAALAAQQANDTLLLHATEGRGAACPAASVQSGQANIASAFASGFCGAGGWLDASGGVLDVSGGLHGNASGFLGGVDRVVGAAGTRLGVAVGYDESDVTEGGGKASIATTRFGIYAAQPVGRFTVTGDVMAGLATTRTTRDTGDGGAAARAGGTDVSGALQLGRLLRLGDMAVTPAAGFEFASIGSGRFADTGAQTAFDVTAAAPRTTSLRPYVSLLVAKKFITARQIVVTPQASLGVSYEAGTLAPDVTVTTADGTAFSAGAKRLDAAAGKAMFGVSAGRRNWSVNARYMAQVSGNWSTQTVEAALSVAF